MKHIPLSLLPASFVLRFILMIVVITLERVNGLPVLFVALAVLWLESAEGVWKILTGLLLSWLLATWYMSSFALAFILIMSVWIYFNIKAASFKWRTPLLLIISLLVSLILGVSVAVPASARALISAGLSILLSIGISRLWWARSTPRYFFFYTTYGQQSKTK